jgi:hypothetical protein
MLRPGANKLKIVHRMDFRVAGVIRIEAL